MIDHIEIYVSDLQKSRDYYAWLLNELGWSLYQEFDGGFSYRHQQAYIVFVQTKEHHLAAGYNRCRIGLNHLAFKAPDKASVDDLVKKLNDKGISVLYADRHPDLAAEKYTVYFEDPDRIKLEYTYPTKVYGA